MLAADPFSQKCGRFQCISSGFCRNMLLHSGPNINDQTEISSSGLISSSIRIHIHRNQVIIFHQPKFDLTGTNSSVTHHLPLIGSSGTRMMLSSNPQYQFRLQMQEYAKLRAQQHPSEVAVKLSEQCHRQPPCQLPTSTMLFQRNEKSDLSSAPPMTQILLILFKQDQEHKWGKGCCEQLSFSSHSNSPFSILF